MTIRPGIYFVSALLLTIICSLVCCVYAEESATVPHQDSPWGGIWTDANYSLSLSQNGSTISGIATTSDSTIAEAFRLTGTLSKDGKTLKSVLTNTGTLTMNLSEDKMLFDGIVTIDPVDNVSKPSSYTFNGTRNGTTIVPDQEWTGIWESKRNQINLIQNGTFVSGDYHPLTSLHFGGLVNGTTSADRKILSLVWISPEITTFTLSDDGTNIFEGECTEEKIRFNGYCLNLTKK
ncbi:hypothetical protein [Methanospirillum lacunae]|uniref:Uncharacterized protein n=1 Tax=Methanospirillum lacunae TaxID=668570 RepID=A0A2V2NFY3_9EURY|nr:hypothetical protein [Methanospirillum lacunae]PWR74223.1 hypothetical protein DK846_03475 [Methanospirillum lacunae]